MFCNITGETYYGSTCQPLKRRLAAHKCCRPCSSKIIIDRGDYSPLIPLETDLSYCEKRERENWYISNNACVNKMSAKSTVEKRKQIRTKWNKKNKEKLKKQEAENYQKNKKYYKQYNYWRRANPIGILARAYFN